MRSLSRTRIVLTLLALLLVGGTSLAIAAETEPAAGGWKGKTNQGYHVYFGVGDGTVNNLRITFREVICGKQSIHLPKAELTIDESGRFGGAVIPNRLEFEGTFVAPKRVEGKVVSLETTGLPGCTRKVVPFTAHPRARR